MVSQARSYPKLHQIITFVLSSSSAQEQTRTVTLGTISFGRKCTKPKIRWNQVCFSPFVSAHNKKSPTEMMPYWLDVVHYLTLVYIDIGEKTNHRLFLEKLNNTCNCHFMELCQVSCTFDTELLRSK